MDWLQNCSAVDHSLGLTVLVVNFLIVFLFWELAYKRMKGHVPASATLLLMVLRAVVAYRMPVRALLPKHLFHCEGTCSLPR